MTNNTYKNSRLRNFRKANKLSQEDVAIFLGVKQGYISQVEKKGVEPRELMIKLINNDKGWDVSELENSSNTQVNTNGDNKIFYETEADKEKDIRIAELTAKIEEKDKMISMLWSKIDEYLKR